MLSNIDVTSAKMWFSKKPDLTHMQIFGSIAYSRVLGSLKKLDSRSKESRFIGYTPHGYRLWDPKARKVFLARDVHFVKSELNTKTTNSSMTRDLHVPIQVTDKKNESVQEGIGKNRSMPIKENEVSQ